MTLNCMIVDDEPIARDLLQHYISRIPALALVKSCRSATEAYEGFYEYPVDLILLDIQMPVITGTDFLRSLRKPPFVIFTTAHAGYAVEGFELNAVDYLLKPITFERFYQAVQKAIEKTAVHQPQPLLQQTIPDYIFIKQDTRLVRVNYSGIDYIQAEKDFCSVFLGTQKLLAGSHLKIFEELLPLHQFLRIHRSYIVNLDKIKAIKGNIVELSTGELPIGANYRQALMDKLGL